ncbi:hypothetical protein AYI68_g2084 [Smittium mucronatum]|uniref:Uncharacterized protein n=1 Tax=Smittium mucronatum TaxID=133383 RepID=A0A1R0H3Q4_9FUNG|nr:hypothetical protein AYI68_g2084 [Smittium mucronatum]
MAFRLHFICFKVIICILALAPSIFLKYAEALDPKNEIPGGNHIFADRDNILEKRAIVVSLVDSVYGGNNYYQANSYSSAVSSDEYQSISAAYSNTSPVYTTALSTAILPIYPSYRDNNVSGISVSLTTSYYSSVTPTSNYYESEQDLTIADISPLYSTVTDYSDCDESDNVPSSYQSQPIYSTVIEYSDCEETASAQDVSDLPLTYSTVTEYTDYCEETASVQGVTDIPPIYSTVTEYTDCEETASVQDITDLPPIYSTVTEYTDCEETASVQGVTDIPPIYSTVTEYTDCEETASVQGVTDLPPIYSTVTEYTDCEETASVQDITDLPPIYSTVTEYTDCQESVSAESACDVTVTNYSTTIQYIYPQTSEDQQCLPGSTTTLNLIVTQFVTLNPQALPTLNIFSVVNNMSNPSSALDDSSVDYNTDDQDGENDVSDLGLSPTLSVFSKSDASDDLAQTSWGAGTDIQDYSVDYDSLYNYSIDQDDSDSLDYDSEGDSEDTVLLANQASLSETLGSQGTTSVLPSLSPTSTSTASSTSAANQSTAPASVGEKELAVPTLGDGSKFSVAKFNFECIDPKYCTPQK